MNPTSTPEKKATFSEKFGGKIFVFSGIIISILIGSTISLVMEETFRQAFLESAALRVRLISLGIFPSVIQIISGLLLLSALFFVLKYIKGKKPFTPFIRVFVICLTIMALHLGAITAASYIGAADFRGIAEEGYIVVDPKWEITLTPWSEIEGGSLDLVRNKLNREMFQYTFDNKNGKKEVLTARISDSKSLVEASWILLRNDLKLNMSEQTSKRYESAMSILGL